jgi:hypothetical protein
MDHTSQYSRTAERPPAIDTRGGKTSENSFTVADLVVEYSVGSWVDFCS